MLSSQSINARINPPDEKYLCDWHKLTIRENLWNQSEGKWKRRVMFPSILEEMLGSGMFLKFESSLIEQ